MGAKLDGKVPVNLKFLRYRITSMEDDRCKIQYPGPYKILNLERGGKLPVELKEAKLDTELPVDQGNDVSWTTVLAIFMYCWLLGLCFFLYLISLFFLILFR